MADEPKPDGAADPATQAARPKLNVLAQYIRDMSFENVAMQKGVRMDGNPEVGVQVAIDAKKRGENEYETILKVKTESKMKEETVFILELEYAGLFKLENVPANQLHPFLMIECPRMIFPYLRRIIGDVTRDGGFPPLNVDNIDFLALYQQNLLRQQAAKADSNGAAAEAKPS